MQSYTKGDTAITYSYDSDGLRTKKVVNGVEYDYYYVDGVLMYEKKGDEYELFYRYDADGRLAMVVKNRFSDNYKSYYYVITNSRGDVLELYSGSGALLVKYTYDAWGKLISVTDANGKAVAKTHFAYMISVRYRGYVYDNETGLYYLQSRYYDPETGRFINADDAEYIGTVRTTVSYNLFVYCNNEPVQGSDPTGMKPFTMVGAGIQIELGFGAASGGLEIVWFFSPKVKVDGRKRTKPFVYLYGGAGIGSSAKTKSVLNKIISKPSLLFNPKSLVSGFSISVCVFAIFGYSNFKSYRDYLKWFSGTYACFYHVKTYTSWSSQCFTVGAGWSSNYAGFGYSKTYYFLSSQVFSGIQGLYNTVLRKAKTLRR